jgi:hypothetical protein
LLPNFVHSPFCALVSLFRRSELSLQQNQLALRGVGAKETASQLRFSSGRDFSRAVTEPKSSRLQPLRDEFYSRDTDSKPPTKTNRTSAPSSFRFFVGRSFSSDKNNSAPAPSFRGAVAASRLCHSFLADVLSFICFHILSTRPLVASSILISSGQRPV